MKCKDQIHAWGAYRPLWRCLTAQYWTAGYLRKCADVPPWTFACSSGDVPPPARRCRFAPAWRCRTSRLWLRREHHGFRFQYVMQGRFILSEDEPTFPRVPRGFRGGSDCDEILASRRMMQELGGGLAARLQSLRLEELYAEIDRHLPLLPMHMISSRYPRPGDQWVQDPVVVEHIPTVIEAAFYSYQTSYDVEPLSVDADPLSFGSGLVEAVGVFGACYPIKPPKPPEEP